MFSFHLHFHLHFYSKNIRIRNFLLYGFDFVHSEAILLQLCAIQYQFHENRLEVVDSNFKVNLVAFGTNLVHCVLMKLLYDNKAKQAASQRSSIGLALIVWLEQCAWAVQNIITTAMCIFCKNLLSTLLPNNSRGKVVVGRKEGENND